MGRAFKNDLRIRTARKQHECHAHKIFKLWNRSLPCDGTIQKGERYYDDRREAWETIRYHIRCGAYGSLPDEEPGKEKTE